MVSNILSILVRLALGIALAMPLAASTVRSDDADQSRTPPAPATVDPQADPRVERRAQETSLELGIIRSVLGETSPRPNGIRYLVSEIRCANGSDREITLPVSEIRLFVDGQELRPQFHPDSLQGYAFDAGHESLRFRDLQQAEELRVPPAGTQTTWLVYTDLPGSGDVPQMVLERMQGTDRLRLSLNDAHREMLMLTHERMGPRNILALLTISGELDTINVGALIEDVNQLSNQGVSRVVVNFAEPAAPLPNLLGEWLEQTAQQRDRSRLQSRFPTISPAIQELHVASLPGDDARAAEAYHNGRPHIHRTAAAAVEAALEPIFRGLSADEIVDQIERGHPLVQAAALATGGRQLSAEQLPLILSRAGRDDDPLLKRGALLALSEFGQPKAVACLVAHARSDSPSVATIAVECLAASRFESAHVALEQLLSSPLNVPLVELGRILSRYPRARWLERLRQLAAGDGMNEREVSLDDQASVRRDALAALDRIGHPDLVGLLGEALAADDEHVRQTAFTLLLNRTDAASEQMAVAYALELTRSTFPSQQILSLFQRVRDQRAVLLLVQHLDSSTSDRSLLIKTLAQIGDDAIDRTLAEHYDALQPREQATVLSCLTDLDSSLTFSLAKQGIESDDNVIFHPSVRALQEEGTRKAVAVLTDALLATSHSSKANSLVRALEGIGTNDALNSLRRARYAGDSRTEQMILRRLLDIQQRSPAAPHLNSANEFAQNEQWQEAVKAYSSAIEIDPELSDAYSGRGHCQLHLEQLEPAAEDFQQALKSNPYDSLAVTGIGIALVREGKLEQGMQVVEVASDRFPHDMLFAYNTACVYGRAIEATLQDPPSAERDVQVSNLQAKAVTQLRLAAERGFDQFDFMKRDPDLAPLADLEEFQQLEAAGPGPEPQSP